MTFPLRLGYKASAEQFGPNELLDFAVLAEEMGGGGRRKPGGNLHPHGIGERHHRREQRDEDKRADERRR